MNQNYSDEILNAYLDNELTGAERKKLIEDLRGDKLLRQRVCQLEQVRNMVKIAYHDVEEKQHEHHVTRKRAGSIAAIAASIFVIVGALAGWYAHQQFRNEASLVQLAEYVEHNQAVSDSKPWRVLIHVTSDEPHRLETLFHETESILEEFATKQQKVSVQILTNSKGLNLLNKKQTTYGKKIAELQEKYDNIVFMACARAIERMRTEKGMDVELLPNTQVTPSAIHEVLQRQREGWTYIRI